MMIITNLVGGLGNQMFQYAFGLRLAEISGEEVKFSSDMFAMYKSHNGFELERVFGRKIDLATSSDLSGIVGFLRAHPQTRRVLGKTKDRFFRILAGGKFISEEIYMRHKMAVGSCYYQGYWQSEDFFPEQVDLRDVYSFVVPDEDVTNRRLADEIMSDKCSVSVHIRRGDYLNPKVAAVHGICSEEYYHLAMRHMEEKLQKPKFYIFSDDHKWVSENIVPRYPESRLVVHNIRGDSYKDMWLMSLCAHNVVANSTFSWWGAWLNRNKNKVAVAPKFWFASSNKAYNIVPESWVML